MPMIISRLLESPVHSFQRQVSDISTKRYIFISHKRWMEKRNIWIIWKSNIPSNKCNFSNEQRIFILGLHSESSQGLKILVLYWGIISSGAQRCWGLNLDELHVRQTLPTVLSLWPWMKTFIKAKSLSFYLNMSLIYKYLVRASKRHEGQERW